MNRLSLLVMLFLPMFLVGQNGRFRHFTTDDGLAQNSIFAVTQDKQGFLWVGTQDGVCRYDGYSFVRYAPMDGDSTSISGNSIKSMIVDSKGNVWMGTRSGLCRYNPDKNNFTRFPSNVESDKGLSSPIIMALAEDKQGRIWVGTLDKGLFAYDPAMNKFKHFLHDEKNPNSLNGNDVRGLTVDLLGHVWINTWAHGVAMYDERNSSFIKMPNRPGESSMPNSRGAICCDKKGRIWVGAWGRGVTVYDPSNGKMTTRSVGTDIADPRGMFWQLMCDHSGRVWAATAETGLICFDPESDKWYAFKNNPDDPESINDNNVWSVYEDRSGLIWCGTWQNGLNVLNEGLNKFTWYHSDPNRESSLPSNAVWAFCSDGANGIWIGTAAGPTHFDRTTGIFSRPPYQRSVTDVAPTDRTNVQSMCRDPDGDIYMGTTGAGVYVYYPDKQKYDVLEALGAPGQIRNSIVSSIICDRSGHIWVAGGKAMQRYDKAHKNFTDFEFTASDSIASNDETYVLCVADNDHIWVGMESGKLFLFEISTGKFKYCWHAPANEVTCLLPDEFGGLWIGTGGSGLFYYKDGKTTAFNEQSGLPNNVIGGILKGDKDEIWISTNKGLCRLDPLTREISSYNKQDGLQGNEFNQNAFYKTADGQLWFGGANGLSAFYPKDIVSNQHLADAVITHFTVLNKKYDLPEYIAKTDTISLTWKDYFFSFEFTGLEFSNPLRNKFKYMMEGFDQDWIESNERRFVTYTNLDPGEYTFHVMASNNDGIWGGKEAVIHIFISPPFWRTKWFYALCVIAAVLLAWGFIRRRERQLRKDKEVLETKVNERTFELNQEKEKVTAAHKDIRDSINYAQRIQYALLAHDELLKQNLREHFIFFRPKDVVSGDFYWGTTRENRFYLAVCDSTGHGVPGAFMSLLNISFLNEAINEKQITSPSEVFDHVRERLISNISQDGEGKDGMDAVLVEFVKDSSEIRYCAAHNAPLIIRPSTGPGADGEVIQLDADKMPVGKGEKEMPFTLRTMSVQRNDVVYFYTDGFADQFGGPQGKKFKEANLRRFLQGIATLSMPEQREKLSQQFDEWKGQLEQIDDVLIVGVRI